MSDTTAAPASTASADPPATILEHMRRMMAGEIPPPAVSRLVGFTADFVEPGHTLFRMDADERHANPMGTLHGGILCDLADAAMGTAWGSTLGEGETYTTVELKINFMRPVWRATLTAEARVIGGGRTVGLTECRVTDEKGRLVAHATSTLLTLRGDAAQGR
ncbi:PaaI family thioesterase [Longimicrobium sp.]|uniref:PaaI family thioesterase n=1 Tax=Longimicrobium sp. TaxID=2029185 RepID=UPI002E334051|nr:PaaI family thioesterase [Longimicrobium sp.]HEX6041726.1 PaaI family thioesterase [Longimicrobium sp.]